MFIQTGTIDSYLHLHNFLSVIWPEGRSTTFFHLKLKDKNGKTIGKRTVELQPFGVLSDSLKVVFPQVSNFPQYGTILIKLKSNRKLRAYARQCHKGIIYFPSPFWVQLSSKNGSEAYVHSVGLDYSESNLLQRLFFRITNNDFSGSTWESSRTYELVAGESINIYLLNQNWIALTANLKLIGIDGTLIYENNFETENGGIQYCSLIFDSKQTFYIRIEKLSTSNSKPYVLIKSQEDMFALTHG